MLWLWLLWQVFLRPAALTELDRQRELRRSLHAVIIQKHIRRYLAQKAIIKLRVCYSIVSLLTNNVSLHTLKIRFHWGIQSQNGWKAPKPKSANFLMNIHLHVRREKKCRIGQMLSVRITYTVSTVNWLEIMFFLLCSRFASNDHVV